MTMQPADVLDRLTIVLLYTIHGAGHVEEEAAALMSEIDPALLDFVRLLLANANIWKLESDIRKGKDGEMSLEEIGRRAISIRDMNKVRVALKDKIAKDQGGFRHIKHDHASA